MAEEYRLKCDQCILSYTVWSDGHPYTELRIDLGPSPFAEEDEALEVERNYVYHPEVPIGAIVGVESDVACLDCGKKGQLDLEKDTLICSHCQSTRLKEILDLEGASCPKCKNGEFVKELTGAMS